MRPIEPMSDDAWIDKIESGMFRLAHYENQSRLSSLDPDITAGPFRRADVVQLGWRAEGSGDGLPWIAILQLADGRWVYFAHEVHITNMIDRWTYVFAAHRGRLWWWACTEADRERLSARFSADDHGDELVQLDIMLQSEDPLLRMLAEQRMARIHGRALTTGRRRGP